MSTTLIYNIVSKIINMSITAGITILAVLLVRLLLKKAPKIFSYALWGIVLFRLLCPFSFTSQFSLMNLAENTVARLVNMESFSGDIRKVVQDIGKMLGSAENVDQVSPVYQEAGSVELSQSGFEAAPAEKLSETPEGISAGNMANGHIDDGGMLQDNVAVLNTNSFNIKSWIANALTADSWNEYGITIASVLAVVWLTGIIILLLINLAGYIRMKQRVSSSMPFYGNIFLSDEVDTPFCLGMIKPCIYLPSSLGEGEREYIILHEQHHIKRGDHVVKVLAFLALCVHWFNPLVWLAFVLAGKDMEMSCDEAVMRKMGGDIRAEYCASLLHLATGKRVFAASPLAFGEGDPKQRIKNIMDYKRPGIWLILGGVVICVIVAFVLSANPEHIDLFKNMDHSKIESVIVFYPNGNQDFYSDDEHMNAIHDFMQSMKCHKTHADNKAGFGVMVDFCYADGKQKSFTFHGDRKVSVADYVLTKEEVRKYNEADGKFGVVIDGGYVTVDDYPPVENMEVVDARVYKCSQDYSGELMVLLNSLPPVSSLRPTDSNLSIDYLPNEKITEEPSDDSHAATEHVYYVNGSAQGNKADNSAHVEQKHTYIPADGEEHRVGYIENTQSFTPSEVTEQPIIINGDSSDGQEFFITYNVEGLTEVVPAKQVKGTGYALLLPKEGWIMNAPDSWCLESNPRVSIWVTRVMDPAQDVTEDSMISNLTNMGFRQDTGTHEFRKTDVDVVTVALIKGIGTSAGGWYVFYRYPEGPEAEEGWGSRLRTIADGFTLVDELAVVSPIIVNGASEAEAFPEYPANGIVTMGDMSFALGESRKSIMDILDKAGIEVAEFEYVESFDKHKYDTYFDIDGYLRVYIKNDVCVRLRFVDSSKHEYLTLMPQTSRGIHRYDTFDYMIDMCGYPAEEHHYAGCTMYRYYYGNVIHEFGVEKNGDDGSYRISDVDIYNSELMPVYDYSEEDEI